MPLLILVALILFFVFGSPGKTVANMFWKNDVAPWEKVDAFYYPDKADLTDYNAVRDLGSVQACRDSVAALASANGDPGLTRGDYECGIERLEDFGGVGVYRVTTR